MNPLVWLQVVLVLAGAGLFVIGTIGLLRMPDAYCRLHALTKVDNLGLGLIILGLVPGAPSLVVALKLVLIWLLILAASATIGHLVANAKYTREEGPRGAAVEAGNDIDDGGRQA